MAPNPTSADRARRLLALLPHLREQGRIPLSDLARLVGSDPETVADDLGTLSLCGTDQADPGALVALAVEGENVIVFGDLPALEAPVRLTAAEAAALLTALGSCGIDAQSPLAKRLAETAGARLDLEELARSVRTAGLPGGIAHTNALLAAAAGGRRVVRLRYAGAGDVTDSLRTVHPLLVFLSRGMWYLRAFDVDRDAERTFRIDRVSDVEVTGAVFEPAAEAASITDATPELDSMPRAEIVFARDAPDLNPRDWPGAGFERLADGRVRASVPFAGTAWLARKVASKLGDAVVEGPAEVRRAVAEVSQAEQGELVPLD